jgi:D-alanyl-D-alanine carboxypeptidase/D-alanyl-D-alanine-endopeptidase (penicillin-binding protein 4)
MRRVLLALMIVAVSLPAAAAPKTRAALAKKALATTAIKASEKKPNDGAHARVTYGKELRPAREVLGRRDEPLTLEEDIAKQMEKLLRGPLRNGVTGLFVADARSGEPIFSVNGDDPLNPASNVKMISTATALELLGPSFKYTTRLLGREVDATGNLHGDIYLLGTWDPTLSVSDMDDLAQQVALRGVHQIDGDVLVGSDPTRDGIYRAMVPIEITAGEPGEPPTATIPASWDLIEVDTSGAKTEKRTRKKHRLTFKTETILNADGKKRLKLTVGGTIGKEGETLYPLYTRERTLVAAHALRASLRAHSITVNGDVRVMELGDFIGGSVAGSGLPVELARHESLQLQDIVARCRRWMSRSKRCTDGCNATRS